MTSQIPDDVRYRGRRYAVTAVEGVGLFDPTEHGIEPGMLSTACWRGFVASYVVEDDRLELSAVQIGRPAAQAKPPALFGVRPTIAGARAVYRGALRYQRLSVPVGFTGRLLLGADAVHLGYLNMGFRPAWLYQRVHELTFDDGQLASAQDRSAALAHVRDRLGAQGLKPPADTDAARRAWVDRSFSLGFDYSWPSIGEAPDIDSAT